MKQSISNQSPKVVFIGSGSVVFAQSLITDILTFPELQNVRFMLHDIDPERLDISARIARRIIDAAGCKAQLESTLDRAKAIEGADFVFVTILVDGWKGFKNEIEIPMKYGINQAVGDTTGPGGVFRALRTIPVMLDIAGDIRKYANKGAVMLNYTNPMHMISWAVQKETDINYVGLCHGVQGTARTLAGALELDPAGVDYLCAGINHLAWFLKFNYNGQDMLPQIRELCSDQSFFRGDPVRAEMCRQLGYYMTEGSAHDSEYVPWFRKKDSILVKYLPGGINNYAMTLKSYESAASSNWKKWDLDLAEGRTPIDITRSEEYGAGIIRAMVTGEPFVFNGNVRNTGLITNLPEDSCVEVPCTVDKGGIHPMYVGALPPHLAGICRQNIICHELAVMAAVQKDSELAFQAICYDPLSQAVCSLQELRNMCYEMFQAQKQYLSGYPVDKFKRLEEIKISEGDSLVAGEGRTKEQIFLETNVIDQWHIIGPFDNLDADKKSMGLSKVFPPEEAINLRAEYIGKGGTTIKWKLISSADMNDDGLVDFCEHYGKIVMAVAYAYTILESQAGDVVNLMLGSDDGIAVWLNGKEVLRKEATRGAERGQEEVTLRLKHGRNDLLLKIDQKLKTWGFYANFDKQYPGVSILSK